MAVNKATCGLKSFASWRRMTGPALAAAIMQCVCAAPAASHEFWLEPSNYTPSAGEEVSITLKNGQQFKGNALPYITAWFERFVIADAKATRDVKSIEGDDPAARTVFAKPGLAISAYHSTPDVLAFKTRKKFDTYLKFEGLEHISAKLGANWRFPDGGLAESYVRCAKTLIFVAGGGGADRAIGMPLEIIAQRNPYTLPPGSNLPVRIVYKGKPLAGLLIKVFAMRGPKTPQRLRTDAKGRALIPLPHKGAYLLNAVHMLDPPATPKAKWKSYWASLTFSRP